MILQPAPPAYNAGDQNRVREAVSRADSENIKFGKDAILARGERLVLVSPDGTQYALSVDNAGTLSTVSYP